MKIYGVAILAACYFAGLVLGEMLGSLFGVKGNLGGVGFGMLFFILLTDWMKKKNKINMMMMMKKMTKMKKKNLKWKKLFSPLKRKV